MCYAAAAAAAAAANGDVENSTAGADHGAGATGVTGYLEAGAPVPDGGDSASSSCSSSSSPEVVH